MKRSVIAIRGEGVVYAKHGRDLRGGSLPPCYVNIFYAFRKKTQIPLESKGDFAEESRKDAGAKVKSGFDFMSFPETDPKKPRNRR
ncbi:MAG: hypothetical protein ACLFV2_05465 [Desulfurivibrionaceae bacterium]